MILVGPRGIGKTVTLGAFEQIAIEHRYQVISIQVAAGASTLIASMQAQAEMEAAGGGFWSRAVAHIASLSVQLPAASVTLDRRAPATVTTTPETLADALAKTAEAAQKEDRGGGLLLTVDEIQVAAPTDLTLLAAALQQLNRRYSKAPVLFAASGLDSTYDTLVDAGLTNPDRLFDIREMPPTLPLTAAMLALTEPATALGVSWHPDAAERVATATRGHPADLQQCADQTWELLADGTQRITVADAQAGLDATTAKSAARLFRQQFHALTDRQREFIAALALHSGATSTAKLAVTLGRTSQHLSSTRAALIEIGHLGSAQRGQLALERPMFGAYVLEHYESARQRANYKTLSLDEMRANIQAAE